MSRSLLFWLLLGLWFIVGWWLCRTYLCGASGSTTAAAAAAPIVAAADKCDTSLSLTDGSTFNIGANRNLRFLKSDFNNIAFGTDTENALQKTADYLKNNPERSLTISGKYDDDESYSGILPNLGMARATTVKNLLTGYGAPASQLEVRGEIDRDICYTEDSREGLGIADANGSGSGSGSGSGNASGAASGNGGTDVAAVTGAAGSALSRLDTLNNGIGFSFGKASSGDARLAAIKERLYGKPLTLYFATNATKLSLSTQQKQDMADLSYYLDKVPGASLSVDGHTDSRGGATLNRRLSKGRAEFVKNYITRNAGINASRMNSAGFGPERPIGSNDTKEGRAKNRRVEVILK